MVDQPSFLLKALTQIDNNTFPFQQHLKVACDLLPPLTFACLLPFEHLIKQQMVWLQDSILERLHHHTLFNILFDKIFETHCAWILSCFGPKVGFWLPTQPTFPTFQLSSPSFCTVLQMQLGLPHPSITSILWCMCTHPIDVTLSTFLIMPTTMSTRAPMMQFVTFFLPLHKMSTAMWDKNNYTHFLQPHSTPLVDKLTLCSPKMEFTP